MGWYTDGWVVYEEDEFGDNPICKLADNATKDRLYYARLIASIPDLLRVCTELYNYACQMPGAQPSGWEYELMEEARQLLVKLGGFDE